MTSAIRSRILLLASALLCLWLNAQQPAWSAESAAVPRLMNFSGRATDAQGKAISGIVGVTFAIYKDQYEGSPLWLETQSITADAKGNYSVQLGATKPNGLPLDLFSSGQARWLGVTVSGGPEQPRVLLLSVPYALKAADAETVGGLPPSAFVLAAPSNGVAAENPAASAGSVPNAAPPPSSAVTTSGGTASSFPIFTTGTNIQNGIMTQTGASAVNVLGKLNLPTTGTATPIGGKNSQPVTLTASVYNSAAGTAAAQNFRWQAEPVGNNTSTAGGSLNLLYGGGANPITETGFHIASNGRITFATGQIFPGTGSVTSVGLSAPGTDFTVSGSPVTKSGTLKFDWTVPPTNANTANAIVKRDASGNFTATTITATGQLFAQAMSGNGNAISGSSASPVATVIYGGASSSTGSTWGVEGETFSSDPGTAGVVGRAHIGGTGVSGIAAPYNSFYADSNAQQARTAGGWVKAMALVSPAGIAACFNSAIPGPGATTPPCGLTFIYNVTGVHIIDFGFKVDDRFLSITSVDGTTYYSRRIYQTCTDLRGQCYSSLNENQVEVSAFDFVGPGFPDGTFYLIVY
jgi:hypothetical protein